MVAWGFCLFKKLKMLKMKVRQHDADKAGNYGDAVAVKSAFLERLHNSRFGYKVKIAAGVLRYTEKCRDRKSQNTAGK